MATGVEELVDMLFAMIDEAKSVPLSSEKCIIERDRALDLLDDIKAQFPMEFGEAKKLLAARADYIASAKREADLIRKQAEDRAKQLLDEDELMAQARQKANGIVKVDEHKSQWPLDNPPDAKQPDSGIQRHQPLYWLLCACLLLV